MTAQRHRERPTTLSTHVRYIVNRRADLPTAAKMSTVLVLSSPVASFGGLRLRLAIRGRLLHKTGAGTRASMYLAEHDVPPPPPKEL